MFCKEFRFKLNMLRVYHLYPLFIHVPFAEYNRSMLMGLTLEILIQPFFARITDYYFFPPSTGFIGICPSSTVVY